MSKKKIDGKQLADEVARAIDAALEGSQDTANRWHLGASVIGRDCARALWYLHRWARVIRHKAKLLRVFDRGHREEERIVGWLRAAGFPVKTQDDATGKQLRVSGVNGHFGGSLDGMIEVLWREVLRLLLEFKTHSDDSFAKVQAKGVLAAKPEHYTQMVVYMRKRALIGGLYIAVNKNTDELYIEYISADDKWADSAEERAKSIIYAEQPPLRINEAPSFYKCRFCDFSPICHGKETPAVNCRTCAHVSVDVNAQWKCTKHGHIFTEELEDETARKAYEVNPALPRMHDGCGDHVFNPYMLNGVEFISGNEAENYTVLRREDGSVFKNGPTETTSANVCLSSHVPIKPKR